MITVPCLAVSTGTPETIPANHNVRDALTAGLVELRLDMLPAMPEAAFETLVETLGADKLVITYRHPSEGGKRSIPEPDRLAILAHAVRLKVAYVDIELAKADGLSQLKSARRRAGSPTKIILSMHDFTSTPVDLPDIVSTMAVAGADIAKIATMVSDQTDNLKLLDALKRSAVPVVAVGMGPAGLPSRILGAKFGMPFTYCAPSDGNGTAPGQPTLDDLLDIYHLSMISEKTDVYGVIGDPIAHTMSPAMINAAFRTMGIDAVYLPFLVKDDPVRFVREFRAFDGLGLKGVSVTIPHKLTVMAAADTLHPLAKRIGAINTLAETDHGKLIGVNTDCLAAVDSIESAAGGTDSLAGRTAVVLGAGGAARAVAVGLADRGVIGYIANRTESKGEALAKSVGFTFIPLADVGKVNAAIIANTTSVGMYPNEDASPIPADALPRKGGVVFDAVYNPLMTKLLKDAAQRGAVTVSGLNMFVGQGARQFALWRKVDAPADVMRRVVLKKLGHDEAL